MKKDNSDKSNAKYFNESQRIAQAIIDRLAQFDIQLELEDIIVGATVTRYVFNPLSSKTRYSDLRNRIDDIKSCTQTTQEIMIDAPIKGTSMIGIDVANTERRLIELVELVERPAFKDAQGDLVFALGEDISGNAVVADLAKMPHILIAGTTGSGKSILLNDLIVSLIFKRSPNYVRFLMVDSKGVELSCYNGMPHMLVPEAITNTSDALAAMDYLIAEMERRFSLFHRSNVSNIREYNNSVDAQSEQKLPYIVFIVDEFAVIMADNKVAFETKLLRLTQKSRAAGIHVVLTTQRPDTRVITGTVKVSMPSRIALKVFSVYDSQTIFGGGGAEKLIGRGDALFMDTNNPYQLTRLQCAYISSKDIQSFIECSQQVDCAFYDENVIDQIFVSRKPAVKTDAATDELYPFYKKALRFWLEENNGKASISSIQRALGTGFNRSGRILESLQRMGYVEPYSSDTDFGNRPLKVLVTLEELDDLFPDTDE